MIHINIRNSAGAKYFLDETDYIRKQRKAFFFYPDATSSLVTISG